MAEELMEPSVCKVIIQDSETGERMCPTLNAVITVILTPQRSSLQIARSMEVSTNYNLEELEGMYTEDMYPDRVALKFRSEMQIAILLCTELSHIENIITFIHQYIVLHNLDHIVVNNNHSMNLVSFSCMERFHPEFDEKNLTTLILENVVVRSLAGVSTSPSITCISLSGSTLGRTKVEKDLFWKWMNYENIENTLTEMCLDSIGLEEVPFEMRNLTKLETLSLANNKLKCLPHYFGDLTALTRLFINNNDITYLPYVLLDRSFIDVNISDTYLPLPSNLATPPTYRPSPTIEQRNPEKLSYLAMFSLIQNKVKFDRKDVNRPLWYYFNNISHCRVCDKIMVVHLKNSFYELGFLSTYNYQTVANFLLWQYGQCVYPCKSNLLIF